MPPVSTAPPTERPVPPPPLATRSDKDPLLELALELDAIREEVVADLGSRDRAYVTRVISVQRKLEVAGRALLLGSRKLPLAIAGTALLTLSKVIENMELGHNILHGQWDWMRDPKIHSRSWEWDMAPTARSWQRSHNFQHHTFTNVIGKDRDLGYSAMRVEPEQPWHPVYLTQPIYFFLMAATFEWGIALYEMELDAVGRGEKSKGQAREEIGALLHKARGQLGKDYVLFPALAGRGWKRSLAGHAVGNVIRNVWVHTVVFCGHIPEQTETFTEEEFESESRGEFYRRQLLGSCNLEGSPFFHLLTGNLSHQIEHHLYPDLPSNRYSEIAPRVREVCERHGLPYNSGKLRRQYWSVYRRVLRLALPGGHGLDRPARGTRPSAPSSA